MTVDVVTGGPAAQARTVGLPPPAGEAPGRALVEAVVDGAAQRRPPRRAGGSTAAHRAVRRPRSQDVVETRDRQGRADDRDALEEGAPRGAALYPARGLVD